MAYPRGVNFEGGTLTMFAGLLGMILDRPVIDKTGITDLFAIHLEFSPDEFTSPQGAAVVPGPPAAAGVREAPGIFQAIQEQLGLRLVAARVPVNLLVIDRIERPTENRDHCGKRRSAVECQFSREFDASQGHCPKVSQESPGLY